MRMKKKRNAFGGNGDIYFSDDNLTATKILRNRSSIEKIERFKREVEVMNELASKHIPNIVDIISVELDENHPENSTIIMKKYDGCLSDLIDMLKGNVKLSLSLLLPVIKALEVLSENTPAIYHRDLKPENILYLKTDNSYELFLTDFGICFLKDDEERLTQEITAVGARMYIAPEYEIGRVENVTEKGDIFSVGKIIWWMINGVENALLPSNFWFADDFDLTRKFPNDPFVVSANIIISACLKINPNERCSYNQLIAMIENILNEKNIPTDEQKRHLVEVAIEKRRINFIEKLKHNKLLVNEFSRIYLTALQIMLQKYPTIDFLNVLFKEYNLKSKDGVNFTSVNVDNDSAHYLYSNSFDDIYIPINYNPASKGESYANITFEYLIRSNSLHEKIVIKYNEEGAIVSIYNGTTKELDVEVIVEFFEDMISNYIA